MAMSSYQEAGFYLYPVPVGGGKWQWRAANERGKLVFFLDSAQGGCKSPDAAMVAGKQYLARYLKAKEEAMITTKSLAETRHTRTFSSRGKGETYPTWHDMPAATDREVCQQVMALNLAHNGRSYWHGAQGCDGTAAGCTGQIVRIANWHAFGGCKGAEGCAAATRERFACEGVAA